MPRYGHLRFIITVMVPTGHQFCRYKISAHRGDRNMKPFAKLLLKVQIVVSYRSQNTYWPVKLPVKLKNTPFNEIQLIFRLKVRTRVNWCRGVQIWHQISCLSSFLRAFCLLLVKSSIIMSEITKYDKIVHYGHHS